MYNPYAMCPKCMGDNIQSHYYKEHVCGYLGCDERHGFGCKNPKEHIHRYCKRCRYEWDEGVISEGT